MRKWPVAILLALTLAALLYVALPGPARRTLRSDALGERRSLIIHLPEGYESETRYYPILFLLDAHDKPRPGGLSFEQTIEHIRSEATPSWPDMIVVGIINRDRHRDMLPLKDPTVGRGGGAETFLRFLREELIPWVESRYRGDGFRILYGRSDSGLFALYALCRHPDAFSATIVSSPTLGRSPALMRRKMRSLSHRPLSWHGILYITYGEKDFPIVTDEIPSFTGLLEKIAPPGFSHRVVEIPGEGHIPPTGLTDGLAYIFTERQ